MAWFFRVLFLLVFLPFIILTGCAPTLNYVERESSVDKMEKANGWKEGDGDHRKREYRLFADEIKNREVKVSPHKGYLVQIVNYSDNMVRIEVRKSGLFNPVTASFLLDPMSEIEYHLPTGWYDVTCYCNDEYGYYNNYGDEHNEGRVCWTDRKEVRTSPVITNVGGKANKYHAIIGNMSDRYSRYYYSRHR